MYQGKWLHITANIKRNKSSRILTIYLIFNNKQNLNRDNFPFISNQLELNTVWRTQLLCKYR